MKSFKEFVTEALEVGQWIKQTGSDYEAYGVVVSVQKNGAAKAAVFTSFDGGSAGKAVMKSTKGWYPAPSKINANDVPPKIRKKIEDKAGL